MPTETEATMHGYVAFYKGKRIEVRADTTFAAQKIAAKIFKAKQTYQVTVMLAEKNGEPVIHSTASL